MLENISSDPVIERANRLMTLRGDPGWPVLMDILNGLVKVVTDAAIDFGGWDAQQIIVLKGRAQGAKALAEQLLIQVNEAINLGIHLAQVAEGFAPTSATAEQSDNLRNAFFALGESEGRIESESRVAGSF